MRYSKIRKGVFLSRPNRFVAFVELDGISTGVHVKNTGRCRELLVPGATVILSESENPMRKYHYDLVAVYKGNLLINMDSQAPNPVFEEWLKTKIDPKNTLIHREFVHGDSRFDFMVEHGSEKFLVEVKGVTLENEGICMFPDAPTERGTKHLRGLIRSLSEGYKACIAFVIQMDGMKCFVPNRQTDPVFSEELVRAHEVGVDIICLECRVEEDGIRIDAEIPFDLGHS